MKPTTNNAPTTPAGLPSSPRLEWRHELFRRTIGANVYQFKTLSLLDAVEIEPHVAPLLDAVASGEKPKQYAEHFIEVVRVVCPMLLEFPDDLKALSGGDMLAVVEFYRSQDWQRLDAVRELSETPADPDDATDIPPPHPRAVFYAVAAACAERSGMSVMAFLESRAEFCLDVIVALNAEYKAQRGAGKMPAGQFARAMAAFMGGEQYERDDITAPAWARDLANMTDKAVS